jgi:hypothetical protein
VRLLSQVVVYDQDMEPEADVFRTRTVFRERPAAGECPHSDKVIFLELVRFVKTGSQQQHITLSGAGRSVPAWEEVLQRVPLSVRTVVPQRWISL